MAREILTPLKLGQNAAGAGPLRLQNAEWLTARNAANSADLNLIRADSSDGISVANGALLARSDGKIHLTTSGGVGINRVPTGGLLEIENPAVTSGAGVLLRSPNVFSADVPAATSLSCLFFSTHNTHTTGSDGSNFNTIILVTDSDAVDTATAISVVNIGHSDAMYIAVQGKASPTASLPTGIGMDHNRNGSNENSAVTAGYGIQWWDWSQTNQGAAGPVGLLLKKQNNLDTQHRLLQLIANRDSIELITPEGGSYSGANGVIELRNNSATKFRLRADGSVLFIAASTGLQWVMPTGLAAAMKSNASSQLDIQGPIGGIRVINNAFTQQLWILEDSGKMTLSPGTVTADTPPLVITETWNNAGVTFNAIKLTITDTASAAGSLLMDLDNLFQVRKDGAALLASGAYLKMVGIGGDPGSPVAGDYWYNSTQKSHRFQATSGKAGLVGLLKAQASIAGGDTVASTASETNLATNYQVPANGLTVGKVLRVRAWGTYGTHNSGTVTLQMRVKAGTVTLLDFGAITTATSISNRIWWVDVDLTVISVGATGTIECKGQGRVPTANTDVGASFPAVGGTSPVTLDTTAAQTLQISVQHGASQANNTITMREFTVEVLD